MATPDELIMDIRSVSGHLSAHRLRGAHVEGSYLLSVSHPLLLRGAACSFFAAVRLRRVISVRFLAWSYA